jgi:hypothetical protein
VFIVLHFDMRIRVHLPLPSTMYVVVDRHFEATQDEHDLLHTQRMKNDDSDHERDNNAEQFKDG